MPGQPYPNLFQPFRLGTLMLPNRVVMAPMSTNLGSDDGAVTPRQVAFYRARAEGGVGMIIVEFCCVHRASGRSEHRQLGLERADQIDGHQRLVEAIAGAGSVPCVQLQHGGPGVKRELVGGVAVGPSDVASRRDPGKLTGRALTGDEIEHLIDCFGRSAELGLRAGYQAVELHGAHGYLLTSFLSPFTNHRDDAWGGDEERRLNFPRRVIQRVKQVIGDRPLIFRLSADEFTPKGLSIDDMERIAPKLAAAGADALHVSIGLGATSFDKIIEPMSAPEGWRLPYARRIRQATGVPVIAVGQIRWPATAEKAIVDGDADLIALGRPLLADPEWAGKASRGEPDAIRPCTSCNYCVGLAADPAGTVGCAENPRTGRELETIPAAAGLRGRRAVVVGGGPGGMAAALMLDRAGFRTELVEQRRTLGGGLIASAAPPFKDKLDWYRLYLERRLRVSGVAVTLGRRAELSSLVTDDPAIVVLASGGQAVYPPIAGLEAAVTAGMACDAYEALMGDDSWVPSCTDRPILVYGGGETGCETAEYLNHRGHAVVLVTRSPAASLARAAEPVYRGVLLKRLAGATNITVVERTTIRSVTADGAVVLEGAEGTPSRIEVGRLLIAQGREPDRSLATELGAAGIPFALIGDARHGGRIGDAVRDAYTAIAALCAAADHPTQLAC